MTAVGQVVNVARNDVTIGSWHEADITTVTPADEPKKGAPKSTHNITAFLPLDFPHLT